MPVSPGYRSAACRYATEGPYRQWACLFTTTDGKVKVGVGVMVGVDEIVGVGVLVDVGVFVGV